MSGDSELDAMLESQNFELGSIQEPETETESDFNSELLASPAVTKKALIPEVQPPSRDAVHYNPKSPSPEAGTALSPVPVTPLPKNARIPSIFGPAADAPAPSSGTTTRKDQSVSSGTTNAAIPGPDSSIPKSKASFFNPSSSAAPIVSASLFGPGRLDIVSSRGSQPTTNTRIAANPSAVSKEPQALHSPTPDRPGDAWQSSRESSDEPSCSQLPNSKNQRTSLERSQNKRKARNDESNEQNILSSCFQLQTPKPKPRSKRGTNHDSLLEKQKIVLLDSDDEDLIEIDPASVSIETQRRWAEHKSRVSPVPEFPESEEGLFVKDEPRDESARLNGFPTVENTSARKDGPSTKRQPLISTSSDAFAIQREMLAKKLKRAAPTSTSHAGTSSSFGYEGSRNNRAKNLDEDDDESWIQPDLEPDEEEQAMLKERDTLTRKFRRGKINDMELMKLSKLRTQIANKAMLRAAQMKASAQEDPNVGSASYIGSTVLPRRTRLEVSAPNLGEEDCPDTEAHDGAVERNRPGLNDDFNEQAMADMLKNAIANPDGHDSGTADPAPKGKGKSRSRKKPAKNAREVQNQLREQERTKLKKKKARETLKNQSKKSSLSAKGRGKGKEQARQKASTGTIDRFRPFDGNSRTSGADEVCKMILDDLIQHDPIRERLDNPIFDIGSGPAIQSANKQTQFEQLWANIPSGANQGQALSDKSRLDKASKSFGYARVRAINGQWLVRGMSSTLYHHQLLGAQWMVGRELGEQAPHGGILADAMGLGKTLETLACMVANPPVQKDIENHCKATLIVVPSAVIDQWLEEIERHTDKDVFPHVMRYRASANIPLAVLQDLDIVVTSYTEVMRQFPFPSPTERAEIAEMGHEKWAKKAQAEMGDLHKVSWYRVVLDEAHAIKNNSARTSLACQNLKSAYRWCLTGTPLLNRLEELFPYLRFLKANYSMDPKTFQQYFCDPDAEDAQTRIATLLSYTMMRRTMATTILGRPIVTLPTPHPQIRYINFSAEERVIYRITENRFRSNLNALLAKGDKKNPGNNYTAFLVHLLRLRQCTSHPFMLERTIRDHWTSEDVSELRLKFKRLKKTGTKFYDQCKLWVSEREKDENGAEAKCRSLPFGKSDFGHKFLMDKAFRKLNSKELYMRVTCTFCSDLPNLPTVTECGHIFCKDCLDIYMHNHLAEFEDHIFECPVCEKSFNSVQPYEGPSLHDDEEEEEDSSPSPSPSNKRARVSKAKKKQRFITKGSDMLDMEPNTKSSWLKASDIDPDFPLTPSAKTTALKAVLLKGFQEAPNDKVVIYVQFHLLSRIIGRMCKAESWGFVYLTGEMSTEHRKKVLTTFEKNVECKILISGLKCGGQGLNFTWANRCISLDLWWNHAVEQQAWGRIFRIGQPKETHMTRIVVRNTVDMRLLSMQQYKLKTCERAIEPSDKKETPALELNDLARLFGFLHTDADGKMSIKDDFEDNEESLSGTEVGDSDEDMPSGSRREATPGSETEGPPAENSGSNAQDGNGPGGNVEEDNVSQNVEESNEASGAADTETMDVD